MFLILIDGSNGYYGLFFFSFPLRGLGVLYKSVGTIGIYIP